LKKKTVFFFLPNQCPHSNSPYLYSLHALLVSLRIYPSLTSCICLSILWEHKYNKLKQKHPYFGCWILSFGHKMGSKRDSPVNVLSIWLRKRSMKVKIFLGILLAFCALVALKFTIRDPNFFFQASEAIHIVGLIVLVYKLYAHKTCSGKFFNFSSSLGHCPDYFFSLRK